MSTRRFDHIDLRVKNYAEARRFYAQLLPALGFTNEKSDEVWATFYSSADKSGEFFGFTEDGAHQPNESRISFWAETRAEVDRIAEVVRQAGGKNLEGPEVCAEYSPGYYAFFFEDPSGNKLEICHRQVVSKPV